MKYIYKARSKDGELQVGNIEASSRDAALNILLSHGLFVLSLEESKEGDNIFGRLSGFFERVKSTDLMIFTRQFSTLLGAQVPLSDSLKSLYEQVSNPTLKEVITELSVDVESGLSLSQALSRHPKVFSGFYINLVKSAEITGKLSEVFDFLADYLEKQSILKAKIRNALFYPIFVITLFFVVVVIIVTMVLPQIAPVFEESGADLPFFTTLMISAGVAFNEWWWAIFIALAICAFLVIDYSQSEEGKMVFNDLVLKIPVLKTIFRNLYVSRFAESTRILIKGGLTIPQAIEVSSRTVGNRVYRDALQEAAESVRKGNLLSQSLRRSPYFPPLVAQLITVGESTGQVEKLLEKINNFYQRQVEDTINNLVELIQPALLVFLGVFVAGLFASILIPLYNLTQSL